MNNTNLIGRLTADPEMKYMPSGQAVVRFTLAINRQVSKDKKKELESKGQPTADFLRIVVFGKMAENCANYLKKGKLAGVQGRIQTGSYVGKNGYKVYTTDIIAERVEFLEWSSKKKSEQAPEGFEMDDTIDDDDVPF